MPWGLKHLQQSGQLHFLTFSCYRRRPNLATPHARACFESSLERVRQSYGLCVYGYVVMPEHAHLTRGLVERPEDWQWSSFRHYLTGVEGVIEIESQWTARRREKLGIIPTARVHENPAQAELERGTVKSRSEV